MAIKHWISSTSLRVTSFDVLDTDDRTDWATTDHISDNNTPLFRMCSFDLSCNSLRACREEQPCRVTDSHLGMDLLDGVLGIVLRAENPSTACTSSSALLKYDAHTVTSKHIKICSVYAAKELCTVTARPPPVSAKELCKHE